MEHGIREEEWNDYLDGLADSQTRTRIESHLIGCMACWEFYERLANVSQSLREAGSEARDHMMIEDKRLHTMLRAVFTSLRTVRDGAVTQKQIQVWLESLEKALSPICGAEAAAKVLDAAARYSPAQSLESIRPDNWELFLDRLTNITAAMCGDTFASLIQERGQM